MKILCTIYFLVFSYALVFAQNTKLLTLEGVVKDKNEKPLSNVALELVDEKNPAATMYQVSDENGKFKFEDITPAKYRLGVSGVEYDYAGKDIEFNTQDIVLSQPIILASKEKALEEVEVVARKKPAIEVKPDMMVFNVQSSPTSTGLSGLDLLRKSPGVSVDKDNNILLKGNPGTRVFINGKPSYMDGKQLTDWLNSIRAEDIERIEIISSPSAKYESEGSGGIVNFVMKKGNSKNNGFNGTVTADVAEVLQNNKYQGSYNLSLNYRKDKLTIGGSYGFSNGTEYWRFSGNRTQGRYYKEFETGGDVYNNHNGMLNFDYEFNEKHSLAANLRVNYSKGSSPTFSGSDIDTLVNANYQFIEILNAKNMGNWTNTQIVPSLSYSYKDSAFGELVVTTDYSSIVNTNVLRIDNRFYSDEASTIQKSVNIFGQDFDSKFDITATKVDWNKTWGNFKLEAGLKYNYTHADNVQKQSNIDATSDVSTLDATKSNRFIYEEHIGAAYIQGHYSLKKFTFLLGLRDEYTATTSTLKDILTDANTSVVDRRYNDPFPTVNVGFKPNDIHAFSVQYSRRLRRPYYRRLNPFQTQQSELSYEYGNPNLLPEYTDKIELNYTLMSAANLSLSYAETSGVMVETFNKGNNNSGISYRTTDNLANRSVFNISLSSPLFAKKIAWWSGFVNLNFNYTNNRGTVNGEYINLSAPGFNGYIESNFRLPAKFSFGFSAWFVSPSVWSASIQHQAFGSLDLSIQKKLLNDKLNVKLYMQDVLATANISFYNRALGIILDDGRAMWGSRRLGINLSYTFGKNDKIKPKTIHQEDEGRVKGGGGGIGGN